MSAVLFSSRVRPLTLRRLLCATATVAVPVLFTAAASATPTYKILFNFPGTAAGGGPGQIAGHLADPSDPASWVLYGTTNFGGDTTSGPCSGGCGTVYRLKPAAAAGTDWIAATLHTFNGGTDGAGPVAGVTFDATGALYGTTASGGGIPGGDGNGTVFRLTPRAGAGAWAETVLHRFNTANDATNPFGGVLIGGDGSLYGTGYGGSKQHGGAIFQLSPPASGKRAWPERVLQGFTGFGGGGNPESPLIADASGALYGTLAAGASHFDGAVIKLTPPAAGKITWRPHILFNFNATNGGNPVAGLIADASGSLYGTTFDGGASGWGTVFKLTPPVSGKLAWSHTLLYSFTGGADGGRVASPLVADVSGALYGITSQGGDTACQPGAGCGTVFKLSPPDHTAGRWRLTVLHTFGGEPSDGMPYSGVQSGLIMDASGVLYDTTFSGGTSNYGTVFEITQ